MRFSLAKPLPDVLKFDGRALELDLAFDTVLRYFKLLKDDDFTDYEKIEIAFELFVIDADYVPQIEDRARLLRRILEEFLGFDLSETDPEDDEDGELGPSKKTYDFEKDAGIIYASFLYDYKIDLIEQQGRLNWRLFLQLFENLSEKSKMVQVMGYRAMKTPTEKDAGADYVKHVRRMKRLYRLDDAAPQGLDDQLAGMFGMMKAKAEQ